MNYATEIVPCPTRSEWLAARKTVVTSTEMAALCGIRKYGQTPLSIWAAKRDMTPEWEGNDRTEVGTVLEGSIARLAARRGGFIARRQRDFMRRGPIGASFDFVIQKDKQQLGREGWLLEIKNVDRMIFRDQWGKDEAGRPVAPDHIIIQTQMQLEVSQAPGAILAVLVGGNDLHMVPIARDPEMAKAFYPIAEDFLVLVRNGIQPEVGPDDGSNILEIYRNGSGPALVVEDPEVDQLLDQWLSLKAQSKMIEDELGEIKARVISKVQDASKIETPRYRVNLSNTAGSPGVLITPEMVGGRVGERKGYRQFAVKEKKNV